MNSSFPVRVSFCSTGNFDQESTWSHLVNEPAFHISRCFGFVINRNNSQLSCFCNNFHKTSIAVFRSPLASSLRDADLARNMFVWIVRLFFQTFSSLLDSKTTNRPDCETTHTHTHTHTHTGRPVQADVTRGWIGMMTLYTFVRVHALRAKLGQKDQRLWYNEILTKHRTSRNSLVCSNFFEFWWSIADKSSKAVFHRKHNSSVIP